jgi:1D-myo-inositol-tetrakisphosphate 5-kinase/inositol-polyphosphate multikinase
MVAPGGHTLAAQVGGHAGVLTSEDESLVIKPALPREIEFYQTAATHPAFEALRPFLPAFMGTLKVQGKAEGQDEEGNTLIAPVSVPASEGGGKEAEQDKFPLRDVKHAITPDLDLDTTYLQHLVLENLTHPFKKPNVIDVKIGTVLWDEGASADKRERMEKAARDTTTFETGIRLTGFQVHIRFIIFVIGEP